MRPTLRLGNCSCIALPTHVHVLVEDRQKSYAKWVDYLLRVTLNVSEGAIHESLYLIFFTLQPELKWYSLLDK